MTDDEIRVWTMKLVNCEFRLSAQVIDKMATTGREYRPNAGQFSALYAARVPRFPNGVPAAELGESTEPKSPKEALAEAREKLRHATGPMAKDLAATLERKASE